MQCILMYEQQAIVAVSTAFLLSEQYCFIHVSTQHNTPIRQQRHTN